MPYALFANDAKISKAYPAESDVWKFARLSGLVVDVATDDDKAAPHPVLDNDYEIRPCLAEPNEDPAINKAEAERIAGKEPQFSEDDDAAPYPARDRSDVRQTPLGQIRVLRGRHGERGLLRR